MPSEAATSSGVHPRLNRVHRPQPHRLERLMIELAAVVLAHTALLQNQKIKSAYLRSPWYVQSVVVSVRAGVRELAFVVMISRGRCT